jgi:hypothetical protein
MITDHLFPCHNRYLRPKGPQITTCGKGRTRHTRTRGKPEDKTATPHTDSYANSCVTVPRLPRDWVHILVDVLNGISIKYKFVCYCILSAYVGWCIECKTMHDTSNIRNLLANFRHCCLIPVSSFCGSAPTLAAHTRCIWSHSGRSQNWKPSCWFLDNLFGARIASVVISMLEFFRTGCDCNQFALNISGRRNTHQPGSAQSRNNP